MVRSPETKGLRKKEKKITSCVAYRWVKLGARKMLKGEPDD